MTTFDALQSLGSTGAEVNTFLVAEDDGQHRQQIRSSIMSDAEMEVDDEGSLVPVINHGGLGGAVDGATARSRMSSTTERLVEGNVVESAPSSSLKRCFHHSDDDNDGGERTCCGRVGSRNLSRRGGKLSK